MMTITKFREHSVIIKFSTEGRGKQEEKEKVKRVVKHIK